MPDSHVDRARSASSIEHDALEIDIRALGARLWRRRSLVMACAAIGMLAGGGVGAITVPPPRAAVRLVVEARGTAPDLAGYERLVEGATVASQVVRELTGAGVAPGVLRSLSIQAAVEPPDTIVATANMSDPEMAVRAADGLARHVVGIVRRRDQFERVRSLLLAVSGLHGGASQLRRQVEAEEAGLQLLEELVRTTSPRSAELERAVVDGRVRLKRLAVERDRLLQLIASAADLERELDAGRIDDGVPPAVKAGVAELDRLGGLTASADIDRIAGAMRQAGPAALEPRNGFTRIAGGAAAGVTAGVCFVALALFLSTIREPDQGRQTGDASGLRDHWEVGGDVH